MAPDKVRHTMVTGMFREIERRIAVGRKHLATGGIVQEHLELLELTQA